ncbi:hypothetical protein Ciccas_009072, partial [Cichlidogyrus casuarinus]
MILCVHVAARIRRTRVRGTDQLAIRLKRPLFALDCNGSMIPIPECPSQDAASPSDEMELPENATETYEVQLESLFEYVESSWQNQQQINTKSDTPALRPRRSQSDLQYYYSDNEATPSDAKSRGFRNLLADTDHDLELAIKRSLEDDTNNNQEQTGNCRSTAVLALIRNRLICSGSKGYRNQNVHQTKIHEKHILMGRSLRHPRQASLMATAKAKQSFLGHKKKYERKNREVYRKLGRPRKSMEIKVGRPKRSQNSPEFYDSNE